MRVFLRTLSLVFCLSYLTCLSVTTAAQPAKLSQRPDIQDFIRMIAKKDGFDVNYLNNLFNHVELQPRVIVSISHPAEAKDWDFYENFFITNERIEQGYHFWQHHAKELSAIQNKYGVPSSVIVAILGVETFYGKKQGDYRVIDALTTLAFQYPPRQAFFRQELAEYLRLIREHHLAPMELRGSYAGAIGQPQFMPSSYRYYAVSYAGSHYVNLQKNTDDSMASIANYLKKNGWRRDQPIAAKVTINNKNFINSVTPNVPPTQTLDQLRKAGLAIDDQYDADLKGNIVMLSMPTQPLYYLGFNNFYTIMRYNTSVNYAMAVYTLSNILDRCWQQKAEVCGV